MQTFQDIKRPSKEDQTAALESYSVLKSAISKLQNPYPEIEIEETKETLKIPLNALVLLSEILEEISKGRPVSIMPIAAEFTTQAAAEFLGCSRPHLVKLLESGKIPFVKVGKHRRVQFEDLVKYRNEMKDKQKKLIIDMMKSDEELGLYDS